MNLTCTPARSASGMDLFRPKNLVSLALFAMMPALALAAETDRLTVEDPATGAVKFKVTSEGNVLGGGFTGDGTGLVNVVHWKGTWSSGASYAKDDCVYYGGSSYIALSASANSQPDVSPQVWGVLALRGPAGANGSTGPEGPQGPAGSPDTQSQILSKIAQQADGVVLTLQQGPQEGVSSNKISIKDASGMEAFTVSAHGDTTVNIGTTPSPTNVGAFTLKGENTQVGMFFMHSGSTSLPVFLSYKSRGTLANPTATQAGDPLFWIAAKGYKTTGWAPASSAYIGFHASENFTDTATGTDIRFNTTANGGTVRSEKMRLADSGNLGVGTMAPSQKLEVNGGVRINTAAIKPICSSTTRGTFWFTQGTAGTKDTAEVCAKDSAEAFAWRALW